MRTLPPTLALAALVWVSGCVGDPGARDPAPPAADVPAASGAPIVDAEGNPQEADVLCTFGGAPVLERAGGRVAAGTRALSVRVEAPATTTGVQVGYAIDGTGREHATEETRPISWLAPVRGETRTFEVPVPEGSHETDERPHRWVFYAQLNPGVEDLCYTGASASPYRVRIEPLADERSGGG